MELNDDQLTVLIGSILARFLAAIKTDHKKPEFKLFSFFVFAKWCLHILCSFLLIIIFPDFTKFLAKLFASIESVDTASLFVTCIIGFAGYDFFKYGAKYGGQIILAVKNAALSKIAGIFTKNK